MASYQVVGSPDQVDYKVCCCCETTDDVLFQVPKEYFRHNQTITRRKIHLDSSFQVPLDSKSFSSLLGLLEKSFISSNAVTSVGGDESGSSGGAMQRPEWMSKLDKRQLKFVSACLGTTAWDGSDVRFYEETMPKENDMVWVKVVQVNDTSAVVKLLEYGNIEGIIPFTEITRIRIRSIGKVIKVGRMEAAQVIRMDTHKGYIDLSKKQVTPNEARECEERYRKGNEVRSIVCHVAEECGIEPQEAMETIAFPLYKRDPTKHAWHWLHKLNKTQDVESVLGGLNLSAEAQDVLLKTVQHYMRTKIITVRADLDIKCFHSDGVDAIRDVLRLGKRQGEEREPPIPLIISIVAPPLYMIRAKTESKADGVKRIKEAVEVMKLEMAKRGGTVNMPAEPYVVGDDEADNAKVKSASDASDDDEDDQQ